MTESDEIALRNYQVSTCTELLAERDCLSYAHSLPTLISPSRPTWLDPMSRFHGGEELLYIQQRSVRLQAIWSRVIEVCSVPTKQFAD
jgi:hypothetical protein